MSWTRTIEVLPARPGHGETHSRLGTIVNLCRRDGYIVSVELLTRRSVDSDFATDVCVRQAGTNPTTGKRYLEELAFEVFFTQGRRYARERARYHRLGSAIRDHRRLAGGGLRPYFSMR